MMMMGGKYILKILENSKFKAISKKRFESEWKCSIIVDFLLAI